MNSNAAARLPFLKALNNTATATAANPQAMNAKSAGVTSGDGISEFSRLLVRSQTAAAVSQRAVAPAGKAAPVHRPVSPAPAPRAEPARPSSAADPGDSTAEPTNDVNDVADAADADRTASTARAHAPERPNAARSQRAASAEDGAPDTVAADPAAAACRDVTTAAADPVPTAAELASLAAWGALPMPPAAAPTAVPVQGAAGESAEAGAATGSATAATAAVATHPLDAAAASAPASDSSAANEAPGTSLATESAPSLSVQDDKTALPNDAGLALATATEPDATLAQLAVLSVGAPPHAEREHRLGADLTTPPAWAVGAPGAAPAVRAHDAAVSSTASASVATPLTDPGFHEALGMQVSLLAREGIHQAELRLNPADMGPVSVQITMNGDQARVDFGADLAQTRQAIEAGWAELAASLQEAGFTLSGGGVSQHARQQQEPMVSSSRGVDRSGVTEEVPAVAVVAARPRAGAALDLYA